MLLRPISAVPLETIAGVIFRKSVHCMIPEYLRHYARRRDRRARAVSLRQALHIGTKLQIAVGEATPGPRIEHLDSPRESFRVGGP
jgi:hypothetical protein